MDTSRLAALAAVVDATRADRLIGPQELADSLRALGADEQEIAEVAERVHASRAEHARLRRRESELTALFSSARELAELHDIDTVLERLVARAHDMMGCDLAYLSEYDEATHELRVRTTVGAVSEQFQSLRVPAGRGLVSVIVESRTAQWASRYQDYLTERHDPTIDDAVATEGIVSMLGVPLLSGGGVLGVLFVATRDEYAFSTEQIALLSALADHGAVVLRAAGTLDELQRSEDEARASLEQLSAYLAERDRSSTVHQELVHAVLTGGGFDQVARTLGSALGRRVTIVDAHVRVIGSSADEPSRHPLDLDAATRGALERSSGDGHTVTLDSGEHRIIMAVTAGTQTLGALLLGAGEFELGPVDVRTVERAAQVTALLALQQQAVADAESRTQSELVVDILDGLPERRSDVERRARALDVTLAELDTVLLFSVPGEARAPATQALISMLERRGLVGEYRGFIVAVLASRTTTATAEEIRLRVVQATQGPVLCVSAPLADKPDALAGRFAECLRTARLLEALGTVDRAVTTDEYLPYSAVFDTDQRSLKAFLDQTIGAVQAYDADRGTELLDTLRAFVRCNASPTKTARMLRFHTNTILQRLDRLDTILGPQWRDEENLFRISIAVRLESLLPR